MVGIEPSNIPFAIKEWIVSCVCAHSARLEYREMTILGQGNFSKVFRVRSKFDGMDYAIKRSFRAVTSDLEAKQWQQVCCRHQHTLLPPKFLYICHATAI